MTDVRALQDAAARLEADSSLPHRLTAEARQIENRARQRHPLGASVLDAELAAGLAAASSYGPGPQQLLLVERLHRSMTEREVETVAEDGRLAKIRDALALERRLDMAAGGCRSRARRDADFDQAVLTCRDRLAALHGRGDLTEDAFAAIVDDADLAAKTFASAIGLARRAARLRRSAEAARAAVASLAA